MLIITNFKGNFMKNYNSINDRNLDLTLKTLHEPNARNIAKLVKVHVFVKLMLPTQVNDSES